MNYTHDKSAQRKRENLSERKLQLPTQTLGKRVFFGYLRNLSNQNFPVYLLFAQTTDTVFRFARVQEPRDLFWPVLVAILLLYWAWRRYSKDAAELKTWQRLLLLTLRFAVIITLLIFYLHPQRDRIVGASKVAILLDSSASMSSRELEESDTDPTVNYENPPTRMEVLSDWLFRSRLVDKIREKHDVVVYRFDSTLIRLIQEEQRKNAETPTTEEPKANIEETEWLTELAPEGSETRLGEALRELLQRERGQPLTGVLLISDGGQNSGDPIDSAIEIAKNSQIPIHSVGIGSKKQPMNLRIAQFDVPERAFPGDPFTVKAQVEIQGGQTATEENISQTVPVELWMMLDSTSSSDANTVEIIREVPPQSQQIGRQEIELTPGSAKIVEFEVRPQELGKNRLYLKIPVLKDDRDPDDNLQTGVVEIVDRKDRILIITGGPMRDYQFLCNQLYRDKSMTVDVYLPWAISGISQSVDNILDSFPTTRAEMSQYDCVVAFDPDWRTLSPEQIDTLEHWVARGGGGMIAVAGPVNLADSITGWTSDPALKKIRALYPVDVSSQQFSMSVKYQTDSQPWAIKLTRSGEEAEFLRPADTEQQSRAIWNEFPGFYSFFTVKSVKPTATLFAESSSPDAAASAGPAVIFAEQFYGAGRVFYIGNTEIWRLRMVNDTYFEKIYTKLIRHVSQGRLQRQSERGSLAADKKRYTLGLTAAIRATAFDDKLQPLGIPTLMLDVVSPDAKVKRVSLVIDPDVPGSYSGFVPMLAEGNWSFKLPIPDTDETLVETVQVRMSDLESENPSRNEPLLMEIAKKTSGEYYDSPYKALIPPGETEELASTILDKLPVRSQRSVLDEIVEENNMRVFLYVLCTLLCTEWLLRRLMRLA